MADSQQQLDHYDFINAPQFVDFDDLASQDDPDADKFFETHREEDDFLIPLDVDSISPTVQLLDEENVRYSNEANKAAMEAGLEDVKIEYYQSPQQSAALSQPSSGHKKSINSTYGTPLGGGSGMSSSTSFYTPTGGDDKENMMPSPKGSSVKKSAGKHGHYENSEEKSLRSILAEKTLMSASIASANSTPSYGLSDVSPASSNKSSANTILYNPTMSLISQLDKLVIVSSDEEDMLDDILAASEAHTAHENLTPVAQPQQDTATGTTFSTFNTDKLSFLGLATPQEEPEAPTEELPESEPETGDETLLVRTSNSNTQRGDSILDETDSEVDNDEIAPMELRTPIRNILKRLDEELNLNEGNINGQEQEDDSPRYSIVVAPSVGQQIHWETEHEEKSQQVRLMEELQALNVSFDMDETSVYSEYDEKRNGEDRMVDPFSHLDTSPSSTVVKQNRSSSIGDLVRAVDVEPKARNFQTFGYNPRAGVTIPKTPDIQSHWETEQQPKPSQRMQAKANKNACYFEIDAPKPTSVRRASSCGDLVKKLGKPTDSKSNARQKQPRMGLTVPRTPETAKRATRSRCNNNQSILSTASSNASSVSMSSKYGAPMRNMFKTMPTVPTVSERLASAQNRQPLKATHYVSMAEALVKYQRNTPDRFRSLPRGARVPEKRSASCDARKRASPSPALSPESTRAQRSRAGSFSEKGDNMNRPGTSRATANGPVLPKKVELKPTVPKPFNFGTSHRPRTATVAPKEEDATDFKFKARPAPAKMLHDTTTVIKHKLPSKVTQPMSPHFASDDRLRDRHQRRGREPTKSPEAKPVKPAPQRSTKIPMSSNTTRVHVDEFKTTTTKPFSSSFDARQKEILRRKEEKIKQELDEAKKGREFHANPVPKFSYKLPKKKPAEPTHLEPFQLKSDQRGAAYQEAFKKKLDEEEQLLKEQTVFHAQPADVIHRAPFEPERPTRIIETPSEFHLATELRAAERGQYDEQLREKEREEEERRKEEQARLEELQRQEDIERRRQLVHKAQPFKPPKPFQLKPSLRALTVPQSPAFNPLPSNRRIQPHSPSPQTQSPNTSVRTPE